ncbi:BREX-1 system adenine-specific DNA-methyltransferase PglX [Maridesulfovibrio sp.]|uniref:BREX-1 system adenine-specific DNA-methyltransferase PglX n=1 Tax=Maridesulfovibrio sp. TaxID=2795000 RepID=UPI0029CA2E3A|nr:BREX-1 system adenine-specific DNA-methyltransferase PglX [Maridesulfovibrio sp.]
MPINKSILKSYAPQARKDFIQAVTDKASLLGLSEDSIEPMEIKGELVIIAGRPFPKSIAEQRKKLEARIKQKGFAQVMDETAYTWFNRFTALRYMELHDYLGHGYRVLSNPSDSDIPEILEKATSVDLPGLDKEQVAELRLAGDKDAELYRLLLIKQCNALHKVMPMMFESVNGASELLLPENILQSDSPIRKLVNEIPEENWDEIEVVGWLYQFYISEKKDQVIGKVVKSEDIPAATQLFTPNWIVKYMVQNTVGRKWLMTYPESTLAADGKMEFYIEPAEQDPEVQAQLDAITPKELNPEELTFMDPACGSGHILAEAYDLFKEIYLERGYRTREIPRLILEKNLHGLDIDDRAAQLARFTVLMKARGDNRRILDPENPVQLNIMSIQESKDLDEIASVLLRERVKNIGEQGQQQMSLLQTKPEQASLREVEKSEVSKEELYSLLHLFEDGKTFGSLLTVHDKLKEALPKLEKLVQDGLEGLDMDTRRFAAALLPLVKQAGLLAGQYDFVVANPPYMGSKGLNPKLKKYAKDEFPDSKADLFAMFIERNIEMAKEDGLTSLVTMQSWMFLSSYENLRNKLLSQNTILSMPHLGARAFDSISGEVVQTTTFVLLKEHFENYKGTYIRLVEGKSEAEKVKQYIDCEDRHTASASDFKKIPGSPIAYWMSRQVIDVFTKSIPVTQIAESRAGMTSGDNDRFTRQWYEVEYSTIKFNAKDWVDATASGDKWFPYNKGGPYRKWFGNITLIIRYDNKTREVLRQMGNKCASEECYFKEGATWTDLTSGRLGARYLESGAIFDIAGHCAFPTAKDGHLFSLGMLNSRFVNNISKVINATMHFQPGDFKKLTFPTDINSQQLVEVIKKCIYLAKTDWNSYETAWGFSTSILLGEAKGNNVKDALFYVHESWKKMIQEMQSLEEENNRIFIDGYNLKNELIPEVPLAEITLSCNPAHRYASGKSNTEYEALLRTDTIKELISYTIGCMMGRYSLDEEGLIYAHSNNEGFDPSRYTTFPADEDGIVPVMDEGYFADDATNRFEEFLKVAWSPETLDENLKFVADSLEPKKGEEPMDTIRRFISQKFFKTQHLKVYKKRPIYWLFSSGKQKAFECLVYLHRYNENTLSRMRAMYVTPLQGKYNARIEYLDKEKDNASSTSAAKKIQKELDKMRKKQQELREYDELLRHYADQKITLDLDDGVKVNYGKFGKLLAEVKAVTGKNPE